MLLKYYSMSVWFAGRKKSELYLNGAAFLLGNVLFFLTVSITVLFISWLPFKLDSWILMVILMLLGYSIFYGGVKKMILKKIDEKEIAKIFKNLNKKEQKGKAYLGLLLFIFSFIIMIFSFYFNFEGYLVK